MPDTTIRDVAKHAGVGIGTVSRVLNNNPSVSAATRQKVLNAIEALNFSPNVSARRLSRGRTMALGVVVPFFTNDSVVQRLRGVVSVLTASDYDLVLFDVETTERKVDMLTGIVRRRMVDGLLIVSLMPEEPDMEQFLAAGLPAVMVDARHEALSSIAVDNVVGAYKATCHLIELGHQQIAFLSDTPKNPFNFSPTEDRFRGYQKALDEAGITFNPDYYIFSALDTPAAKAATHQLLALDQPPTAVFAYSDTQAIGVLQAAEERDLTVPDQLSVIGYDNIQMSQYLRLTTIRQSLFESGVAGAELLLDIVTGKRAKQLTIELQTELIVRQTTAPPIQI